MRNHRTAGTTGSNSSAHHRTGGTDDGGSALPTSAAEPGVAVAGSDPPVPEPLGESVLDGLEQAPALGGGGTPAPVDGAGIGASARQPVPFGVADGLGVGFLVAVGALGDVLAGDGALVGFMVGGGVFGGVLGGAAAVVVVDGAGLGAPPGPFRTMSELPLLWYPSVARIM